MEKILVLNCGSSTIKYKLFDKNLQVISDGIVDKINSQNQTVTINTKKQQYFKEFHCNDHEKGLYYLLSELVNLKVINDYQEISIVGHRVVHGGEKYHQSVIVDDIVLANIYDLVSLSPLHNKANGDGIKIIKELLPHALNVAVFDTSYHQTLQPVEYIYPIKYQYYQDLGLRRYGMHGTSHKYCMEQISEFYHNPQLKIINIHLGNGCSVCAINNQKSIATSMGLTPLAGLMMGTRSGDIDPSIIEFLEEKLQKNTVSITNILNKESGVLGISEISNDLRDVIKLYDTNYQAQLAIDLYVNRIVETVSNYINKLNGCDVISFCAGVGENSSFIRKKVIEQLQFFGFKINDNLNNQKCDHIIEISDNTSSAKIVVVKTNEELAIAKECLLLK